MQLKISSNSEPVYKSLKEFIFRETILAAVIALAGYFFFTGIWEEYYLNIIPLLLLIFYIITAVVHGFLLNAGTREPQKFVTKFMLASGIKMIMYLFFIVIYLLLNPENVAIFLLTFLSFYLIFTVFEVFSILIVLKKNIKD